MGVRFLSAGDSHGEALVGIIEGLPSGVRLPLKAITDELVRRRKSYGRSSRQMIEKDEIKIIGGLWKNKTTGAPLAIVAPNRARTVQGRGGGALGVVPRPGHADYAGVTKYQLNEIPPVAERASARSTVMRVAIGAVAKTVLDHFAISTTGHVLAIGDASASTDVVDLSTIRRRSRRSSVFCADRIGTRAMEEEIKLARTRGDSLGGIVEVIGSGMFPGLGSHVNWDRKIDARLAAAMMSIQSVKAVAVGDGLETCRARGRDAHDAMVVSRGRVRRPTNRAGGIEGGMTNGEDVVVRLIAKPIPTARRRARTFNMRTLKSTDSPYVRSDVCVIPALSVIAESVMAWVLLEAVLEKFGGDCIEDCVTAHAHYLNTTRKRLTR